MELRLTGFAKGKNFGISKELQFSVQSFFYAIDHGKIKENLQLIQNQTLTLNSIQMNQMNNLVTIYVTSEYTV